MAEFKYKSVIKNLENLLKAQEYELADQETKIFDLEDRVKELEVKLAPFIKPVVATKDLQAEVYRIIPTVEKEKSENKGKRKLDLSKEIGELEELRDAPLSKILKVGPALRSILPPPEIPKKKSVKKSRERSTSPRALVPNKAKKFVHEHEPSSSPSPQMIENFAYGASDIWKKGKKAKKKRRFDCVCNLVISF